jgi:transposase
MHRTYYDKKFKYVRDLPCGELIVLLEIEMRRVKCKKHSVVRQENPDWLAEMIGYTKRFAYYVGKRCESSAIKNVAEELRLDWRTVKELEKEYMQEKLRQVGDSTPVKIGIDEISIRKGHSYKIVVSDLEARRAIWFGGIDRSENSLDEFYNSLKNGKKEEIKLVVMDMWKAFENSTKKNVPEAAILYDKFHVIKHLGDALDAVRKSEYSRVNDNDRKFIKGQKYTLLSNKENLTLDGKKSLKLLLKANKRLNVAYVLKESFGQLWDYNSETWARKFFDNWKASLRWQRLKPFEDFAKLIDKHWEGIAEYCRMDNKVALGFVEGFNNKIRVIQRRAYGLKDQEYLRLKVLTCMLPSIK